MVKPEFLLELLVGLFTDPAGFYCGGQRLDRGISRQVRDIIFLLAGRTPLANELHLVARHALHTIIKHSMLMAVGYPNAAGGEAACQRTFRALTPSDIFTFFPGQH